MTGTYPNAVSEFRSHPGCLLAILVVFPLVACSRGGDAPAGSQPVAAPVAALVEATPTAEETETEVPESEIALRALTIEPARLKTQSTARARAIGDGDLDIRYEWIVNGVSEGLQESPTLDRGLERGDEVEVTAIPYRDGQPGESLSTLTVTVENSPPTYLHGAGGAFEVDGHRFHIVDPDGDDLHYTLKGAPPGLTIDPGNGVLSLNTVVEPGDTLTEYDVILLAEDGEGGSVQLTFPVSIPE